MANTTNYNWETPDDTDLVKDGAAAIRTLGSSVDTTTKALNPSTTLGDIEYRSATANTNTRLGIGTTGQVLTVAGGVPTWATSDDANAIQNAIVDAKGDIVAASAADTPARLAVGANGTVLTADSAETTGLKWATPASGSTFVGAKAYGTTNQSISHFTVTAVTWANEDFDTDSMHSTSTNTSRLTIPSGKTGYWQINASLGYDANATGVRQLRLSKNGNFVNNEQVEATSTYGNTMGFSNILYLTAADYIEISAFQTSGVSLDVVKSADTSYFAANFIGA